MESDPPPPKKFELKAREFERLNQKGPAGKGAEHDVFAILQQNRSVEQQKGLGEVEIKPTRSRRRRDYWLVLIAGNLVLAGVAVLGRSNAIVLVYDLAGFVVFNLGLTWVMWFVMDDY